MFMLAFNQYIVTKMDNESINFAIDVANSVLFRLQLTITVIRLSGMATKKEQLNFMKAGN